MEQTSISYPPLSTQRRIVEKLDAIAARCDAITQHLTQVSRDCDALKQRLLQQAFDGEL